MSKWRVLVVDDSATARELLRSVLDADAELEVVGEAVDGWSAVELVGALRPSVVVMDINMPHMDGFEATKRIMTDHPTPIVIVSSCEDVASVEVTLQALQAGAVAAAPKPQGPTHPRFEADATRLTSLVKALADVKVVRQHGRRRRTGGPPQPALSSPAAGRRRVIDAVGVAASTGGPAALYRFLEALPATIGVPILVVQHIAPGFIDGLVHWLSRATRLPVTIAADGEDARAGAVYVAPDDRHLLVCDGKLQLSADPPVGGFRPSADVLFGSLAESYASASAAVVLTGMGQDGRDGAARLQAAGGLVLAQDPDSSVVFGMPRAVIDAGIAHIVGSAEDLAFRIARIAPTNEAMG